MPISDILKLTIAVGLSLLVGEEVSDGYHILLDFALVHFNGPTESFDVHNKASVSELLIHSQTITGSA